MKTPYLIVAFALLPAQFAWAVGSGGYTNQVVGSKALGMGNAFVATADDPSAVFFNPAGLSQLTQSEVSVGLAVHKNHSTFEPLSGGKETMKSYTPIVPNLYVTTPFTSDRWTFGLGVNSPFGLETHWKEDSSVRYLATDSRLHLTEINPTVAFKASDRVSIGFGVIYGLSEAKLQSKVNVTGLNFGLNPSGGLVAKPDADKELSGTGTGWGYDVGILFKPAEEHSLGITYRSEVNTNVDGKLKLNGLSGISGQLFGANYETDAHTTIRFPESVMLGYAFKPGRWTFEADGEWVGYSSNDETSIRFDEQDPSRQAVLAIGDPIKNDWRTSWNLGLGTNYRVNERWQARGGYFYYPSVVPDSTWTPSNPENSRNGFTLGTSFSGVSIGFDLAYNLILFNQRSVPGLGKFDTTAHIFSANVNYRFGPNSRGA